MGLTLEALKQLDSIAPDKLKDQEKTLVHVERARLLLLLGRVAEASEDLKELTKEPLAQDLLLLHFAALGQYARMEASFVERGSAQANRAARAVRNNFRNTVLALTQLSLGTQLPTAARIASLCGLGGRLADTFGEYHYVSIIHADLHTLHGLLALDPATRSAPKRSSPKP